MQALKRGVPSMLECMAEPQELGCQVCSRAQCLGFRIHEIFHNQSDGALPSLVIWVVDGAMATVVLPFSLYFYHVFSQLAAKIPQIFWFSAKVHRFPPILGIFQP